MLTIQHSVKRPDNSAKTMSKRKITKAPIIQNTPLVQVVPNTNYNMQNTTLMDVYAYYTTFSQTSRYQC